MEMLIYKYINAEWVQIEFEDVQEDDIVQIRYKDGRIYAQYVQVLTPYLASEGGFQGTRINMLDIIF